VAIPRISGLGYAKSVKEFPFEEKGYEPTADCEKWSPASRRGIIIID